MSAIIILCAAVAILASAFVWMLLFDQPLDSFSHDTPRRERRYGNGT